MSDPLALLEREDCAGCRHARGEHAMQVGCTARVVLHGAWLTCGCKNFRN